MSDIQTDAIEELIEDMDLLNAELPSSWTKERYEMLKKASEQLTALTGRLARAEESLQKVISHCEKNCGYGYPCIVAAKKYFNGSTLTVEPMMASKQLAALTERIAELEGERDGAYVACRDARMYMALEAIDHFGKHGFSQASADKLREIAAQKKEQERKQ